MINRRTFMGAMAGLPAVLPIGLSPAAAQSAWTGPARILVAYAAGGPADILARILAQELGKVMGHNCIVENVGGASGSIGSRQAAQAAPDGHTLTLGTNQTHATNYSVLPTVHYKEQDFKSVLGVADLQHVFVVTKNLKVNNINEFVELAKTSNGSLNYASAGAGSGSHLAMELFKLRTKVDLTNVTFAGAAPAIQEVFAGRIDACYAVLPTVLGFIQEGSVKPLAIASKVHAPQLPNVPLLSERGIIDAEADSWLGLWAPSKTPDAVLDQLERAVNGIMEDRAIRERVITLGFLPRPRGRSEFDRYVHEEIGRWAEVARTAMSKN